jgi:hypothetical protein
VLLRRHIANRNNQSDGKKSQCARAEFNERASFDFAHHPPPAKSVSLVITEFLIFYSPPQMRLLGGARIDHDVNAIGGWGR